MLIMITYVSSPSLEAIDAIHSTTMKGKAESWKRLSIAAASYSEANTGARKSYPLLLQCQQF